MNRPTKKYYAFEDRPPIVYRPGTSDEAIIQAVIIEKKEYAFPVFSPKIIFDIGGNIGVVAIVMANIYPEAKIYSFEPVEENFELLLENVSEYKNISPMRMALGNKTEQRMMYPSENPLNLGGYSTFIPTENDRQMRKMIDVVDVAKVCDKIGVPDLIKIDCEGAEYEILTAIPDIHLVKWIAGELHGIDDYRLLAYLSSHFRLQHERGFGDKVWHFHALAKSWTDFGRDLSPQ